MAVRSAFQRLDRQGSPGGGGGGGGWGGGRTFAYCHVCDAYLDVSTMGRTAINDSSNLTVRGCLVKQMNCGNVLSRVTRLILWWSQMPYGILWRRNRVKLRTWNKNWRKYSLRHTPSETDVKKYSNLYLNHKIYISIDWYIYLWVFARECSSWI